MIEMGNRNCVDFNVSCNSWSEAIAYAGNLLKKDNCITQEYIDDMIKLVKDNGPYIVVTPGFALAHARPNGHVKENRIAIVTLKNGVKFGHSTNDPVRCVMAIAAKTDGEHLKLFQKVADYLMVEGNSEKILSANSLDDLEE